MSAAFTPLSIALKQGAITALGASFPLAVDNAPFDKPNNAPWGQLFVFHNQPTPASLGDEGQDAHDGIVQVDLNYPAMTGDSAADLKADAIAGFFKAGRSLSYGGVTATVVSCGRSRGREVDGWWRVSVTVTWRARVPRNFA